MCLRAEHRTFFTQGAALPRMCLLALLLLLNACGLSSNADTLTILHINDTHGRTRAEPFIAQMAQDLTAKGENVLILDAGDRLHGQTATNLSKGETMVGIMNAVAYSAMTPGNHDFNFGVGRLLELSELMDFPLLAANIKGVDGMYLFERYAVFALAGLRVGVFGIVTPETAMKSDPRIVAGLIFENPVETARHMVEKLQSEGCDSIIALAHLGGGDFTAETARSDALAELPGIDVVIDGHSHTLLERGRVIGNALIAQAGEHAQHIGIVEITRKNGETAKTARLETVPEPGGERPLPQDTAVAARIAVEEAKTAAFTQTVVGYTPVTLEGERAVIRTRETNLANMICDSMLHATRADIAFLAGGNIRASIEAGDITMGDVLTALPFSNLIVTVEMKGSDVLAILEHGVSLYPEAAGRYIQVGGLRFDFDPRREPMRRVTEAHLLRGGALQPDETYTVATIDFIASGGDGYVLANTGATIVYYQGDAEALVRYLETSPAIRAEPEGRVTAIR